MLTSFLVDDSADQTFDVERNMREFGLYVNRLNEKSNVLNQALAGMDEFLIANKSLQSNLKEVVRLRTIRDQLLIQGIQMGSITGNPVQVSSLLEHILLAQDKLNTQCSREEIQAINLYNASGNDLNLIVSSNLSLDRIFSHDDLNIHASTQVDLNVVEAATVNSGVQVIVYCANDLQFISASGQEDIKVVIDAASSLNSSAVRGIEVLAIAAQNNLNVVLSKYDLQDVVSAGFTSRYNDAMPLHSLLNLLDLGIIVLSQDGIKAFF
jgi:hypothetical protein